MSSTHSSRLQFVLVCLLAGIAALVSCANPVGDSAEAFTAQTLLSSGLTKCKLRFGGALSVDGMLDGNRLLATGAVGDQFHGECQIAGLLGVDFEIRSRLRFDQGSTADIQFRVSNEGRYGVRFEHGLVRLYAFTYPWAVGGGAGPQGDIPVWREIVRPVPVASLVAGVTHDVIVRGVGGTFSVTIAGQQVLSAQDDALPAGRFGIYTLSANSGGGATFDTFEVVGDPTVASNRTLLYSTTGYERLGTKRALVRTLNRDNGQVAGTFTLLGATDRLPKFSGNLSRENDTFGMQLWSADFSAFTAAGRYELRVNMSAVGNTPWNDVLVSTPFDIATDNLSQQVLTKLSVLNAEARRAADEDFRSNWATVSGEWSVTDEGAFITTADARFGSLLDRVRDSYGNRLGEQNDQFTLSGDLTVLSGCDAGLQFFTNSGSRYMVTLMMQSSGPCPQYPGGGAVRLSREGSAVPGNWQVLTIVPHPLQSGLKYDVELRVARDGANTQSVTVRVNKQIVIQPVALPNDGPRLSGDFALRAFAATARFDRVRAWHADVPFWFPENGDRIALDPLSEAEPRPWSAPPGGTVPNRAPTCEERNRVPDGGDHACFPIFTMRHGYHDCNNNIGEGTSHGAFLAGLMDVWVRRRAAVGEAALRRAILTTDAYLADLFRYAGSSGEFVHQEPGRGAPGTSHIAVTLIALYGESAFAAKGAAVDLPRARDACRRTVTGIRWLEREDVASVPSRRFKEGGVWYDDYKSIIYMNASQCMQRTGLTSSDVGLTVAYLENQAYDSALRLAEFLSGHIEEDARYSLRINPALAGIEAVLETTLLTERRAAILTALGFTAPRTGLVAKLSSKIWRKSSGSPPKLTSMGFNVLPQSAGREPRSAGFFPYSPQDEAAFNKSLWDNTASVPPIENQDNAKGPNNASLNPKLQWYIVPHFASSTSNAAILYGLRPAGANESDGAVDHDLEALGAGSLGWITGLNPGLPRTKVVSNSSADVRPWGAAAFIVNAGVPSARGFNSFHPLLSAKTWPFPEEGVNNSPWRERWWINPSQNGFTTVVNGHMIWDGEWDYWNQGEYGWVSGETFLLEDGGVLSGMLRYEDAVNGRPVPAPPSPNMSRPVWRDTIVDERAETGWFFNNVDTVSFAHASRMAHEYCARRGFASGHPTGHQLGSNIGVVCFPSARRAVEDVTDYQVASSGNDFGDINSAPWAQVLRAANVLCTKRDYNDEALGGVSRPHVSGVFTGHEIAGGPVVQHRRGLACLRRDAGTLYNSTWQEHYDSGQGFANVDTEHWAKASRAATNICIAKGHPLGGFFTGVQVGPGTDPTTKGLICYVQ